MTTPAVSFPIPFVPFLLKTALGLYTCACTTQSVPACSSLAVRQARQAPRQGHLNRPPAHLCNPRQRSRKATHLIAPSPRREQQAQARKQAKGTRTRKEKKVRTGRRPSRRSRISPHPPSAPFTATHASHSLAARPTAQSARKRPRRSAAQRASPRTSSLHIPAAPSPKGQPRFF